MIVVREGMSSTSRETAAGPAGKASQVQGPEKKLGIVLSELDEGGKRQLGSDLKGGALVERVEPGSPAAENGVQSGDVILSANKRDVKGPSDVAEEWSRAKAEKKPIMLRINRNGRLMFLAVPS